MKNTQFQPGGLDELVFEGRNKAYGAYVLRKDYKGNLVKAMGTAITLLLLLFAVPFVSALMREVKISDTITPTDKVILIDIAPPTPEPLIIPKAPEPAIEQVKTIANTTPVIVPDPLVKTEMPPNEILSTANTGLATNLTGKEGPAVPVEINVSTTAPVDAEPTRAPDHLPEFIGGYQAMSRFMQNNMIYPQMAKEANISGMVFLEFVVDKYGKISDVKVLKGIGGGCDEEAIRVVKAMPAWKPGTTANQPVSVKFSFPIKFQLNN